MDESDLQEVQELASTYYKSSDTATASRKRAQESKERVIAWMRDNLEEGKRRLPMPDGSTLVLVTRDKKEPTSKETLISKVANFFAAHQLPDEMADQLVAAMFEQREVVGSSESLSRRKKREKKAAADGANPPKRRKKARKGASSE